MGDSQISSIKVDLQIEEAVLKDGTQARKLESEPSTRKKDPLSGQVGIGQDASAFTSLY